MVDIAVLKLTILVAFIGAVGVAVMLLASRKSPAANSDLATCPDCGRLVSRQAASCPQCGRPMSSPPANG